MGKGETLGWWLSKDTEERDWRLHRGAQASSWHLELQAALRDKLSPSGGQWIGAGQLQRKTSIQYEKYQMHSFCLHKKNFKLVKSNKSIVLSRICFRCQSGNIFSTILYNFLYNFSERKRNKSRRKRSSLSFMKRKTNAFWFLVTPNANLFSYCLYHCPFLQSAVTYKRSSQYTVHV